MKSIGKGVLIGIIFMSSLFLISHFISYFDYREDILRISKDVANTEKRIDQRSEGWVSYLERRINSANQAADEHHVFVSKKVHQLSKQIEDLERRVESLEKKTKEIKERRESLKDTHPE